MRVQVTGRVIARTKRKGTDGIERYSIVIEEPGNFPSPFQFTTKSADAFGPADGFARVGNVVTATGYANGKCEDIPRKDGSGMFKKYSIWLTLSTLQPYGQSSAAPETGASADTIEDVPF